MIEPQNHQDCPKFLVDGMAERNIAVDVSAQPPRRRTPYTRDPFICPHGTRYWLEPTSEQIAQWARDGVR